MQRRRCRVLPATGSDPSPCSATQTRQQSGLAQHSARPRRRVGTPEMREIVPRPVWAGQSECEGSHVLIVENPARLGSLAAAKVETPIAVEHANRAGLAGHDFEVALIHQSLYDFVGNPLGRRRLAVTKCARHALGSARSQDCYGAIFFGDVVEVYEDLQRPDILSIEMKQLRAAGGLTLVG